MNSEKLVYGAEIVFVRLLLPLCFGIFFSDLTEAQHLNYIIFLTALTFSTLCAINIFYRKLKIYFIKAAPVLLYYVLIFLIGMLSGMLRNQSQHAGHFSKQPFRYLKLLVDDEPQQKGNIVRITALVIGAITVKDKYEVIRGRIMLAYPNTNGKLHLQYGDELFIPAVYKAIAPVYNPGEFDFQAWMAKQNIYHQAFLNPGQLKVLSHNNGNRLIAYALNLRQKQLKAYRNIIKDDNAFAVAATLILGSREDLNPEIITAYSKTGTIHALSVSGMHVGMIYLVLNWLLAFMDRNRQAKTLKIFLIISLIWFYSLVTGFSPAVLRSAIMLTVFILAKAFKRNTNSYNILAFAAFGLLMYNPFLLWDLGFQLSFLSVFGLIYLQHKIKSLFYTKYNIINWIWEAVCLSLSAQIVTFPLSIYYFHQFPLYVLPANLFILVPSTLMMYLGLGILVFRAWFLAPMFEWLICFTNQGLTYLSQLPNSSLNAIWISKTELCLIYGILILVFLCLQTRNKKMLFAGILLAILLQSSFTLNKISARHQHQLLFFSLKNNYGAAFIFSDTAVVLTDLQKNSKAFQFSIQPALDQKKVSCIKLMKWSETCKVGPLKINKHQILFQHYRILKYDSLLQQKRILQCPSYQVIWLHGNVLYRPGDLIQQIKYEHLVADGSTKTGMLKIYEDSANLFHIKHHILKNKKGYLP
ncbi:ComEC family competence protein [Pedobacter sp. MC2016-14]|uniref:ComEC/Rec2 family competence protein n=1 Tax=Pedobacter sp. MC2016-14 TaxID=2897327 RepID=UPI001E597B6D|nr:ComEC/Rec2 family competence protein [Pedobacter sp. MC2016-14]MCD0490193.1 ComEC family competence protein [Pedobacter sp. MC2016-14]